MGTGKADTAAAAPGGAVAFFGGGRFGSAPGDLAAAAAAGAALLALDAPAIASTLRSGVPCVTADDLLSREEWIEVRRLAARCGELWYEGARELFTVDGVCWPEIDREAMYWFWLDVLAAQALGRRIGEMGRIRVAGPLGIPRRPGLYYYPSDVTAAWWGRTLPGARVDPPTAGALLAALRAAAGRKYDSLASRRRNGRPAAAAGTVPRGGVVLAMNSGEARRFESLVARLASNLPGRFAVAIASRQLDEGRRIAAEHGVPALEPAAERRTSGLAGRFEEGVRETLRTAAGEPWEGPLRLLGFHFRHFCRRRWPRLAASLRAWRSLWEAVDPGLVVVSSLPDAESQVPGAAAGVLGIATASIPHGGGRTRAVGLPAAGRLLYANETMRRTLEREGGGARRMLPCRGLTPRSAYRAEEAAAFPGPGDWRVLALATSTGFPGTQAWRIRPRAQIAALRALAAPPEDVAGRLSLLVKTHPGHSDLELLAAVDVGLAGRIAPPKADLHALLEEADLVLALNYFGSALVHALRAPRPVIFFVTDDLIGAMPQRGHQDFHVHADLYLDAGPVVRTGGEMWETVRAFFADPSARDALRIRSAEHGRRLLDDGAFAPIESVVRSILAEEGASEDADAGGAGAGPGRPAAAGARR